jgi:hypothetical protein
MMALTCSLIRANSSSDQGLHSMGGIWFILISVYSHFWCHGVLPAQRLERPADFPRKSRGNRMGGAESGANNAGYDPFRFSGFTFVAHSRSPGHAHAGFSLSRSIVRRSRSGWCG